MEEGTYQNEDGREVQDPDEFHGRCHLGRLEGLLQTDVTLDQEYTEEGVGDRLENETDKEDFVPDFSQATFHRKATSASLFTPSR
jgi:hypothetical protein